VELEIRIGDIDSDEALRAYLRRHIRFALGRFSRSIRRVTVRVTEGRVAGGRVEMECRIAVRLISEGRVDLIERAPTLQAALDGGIERLRRTMMRRIGGDRSP